MGRGACWCIRMGCILSRWSRCSMFGARVNRLCFRGLFVSLVLETSLRLQHCRGL